MMFENDADKLEQQTEARLYENLTQFMRIFKDIVKSSKSIISSFSNSIPPTHHQNALSGQISTLRQYLANTLAEFTSIPPQRQQGLALVSTYLRLANRLNDIVSICHNAKQQPDQVIIFYQVFLKKIELSINDFKKSVDISKFFKKIFHFSTAFYNGCQLISEEGKAKGAIEEFSKTMNDEVLDLRPIEASNKFSVDKKDGACIVDEKEAQSRTLFVGCIDIDPNYFRSMVHLANNQKDQLYRMMVEKNESVKRTVNTYSTQFQQYVKKRAKIQFKNQKNKQKAYASSLSSSFKPKNKIHNKTIDSLRINTQLSVISFQIDKNTKSFDEVKSSNEIDKIMESWNERREKLSSDGLSFQPIKCYYFNFNPRLTLNSKSVKSSSTSKFRTISTSKFRTISTKRVESVSKDSNYGSKTPKFLQTQLQLHRPPIEIKQLTKNNPQSDQKHQRSIYPLSQEALSLNNCKNPVTNPAADNIRSIRDKRKIDMTKIKRNLGASKIGIEEKLNRTDPNSPLKKEIWLKQLQFE